MNKIIITINRECGSRGGRIAHLLGENLGLKVYDRLMLDSIAEKFDMTVEHIERVKAQKTNWWSDFCRFYQQFGAVSYSPGNKSEVTPIKIYNAEARLLQELAEKDSCIIIGRAGFHIFRENPNALFCLYDKKEVLNSAQVKLNKVVLPKSYLYDISTKAGEIIKIL